jgi:hypothetical protein
LRITIHTNEREYRANMRAKADELVSGVRQTQAVVGTIAMARARWWSSGPYKQRELDRLGHPYARRNAIQTATTTKRGQRRRKLVYRAKIGQGFPARINVQSGDFLHSWKWRMQRTPNGVTGTLWNTSDRTKYLTGSGTTLMMGRPVMRAIMKDVRKQTKGMFRKTLHRALNAGGSVGRGGWGALDAFRRGYQRGAGAVGALGI